MYTQRRMAREERSHETCLHLRMSKRNKGATNGDRRELSEKQGEAIQYL